jgi:hypothetical protein
MPEEMAHLCPVCAYIDWVNATSIAQGYIFCPMDSGEQVLEKNESMLSFVVPHCVMSRSIHSMDRHLNISWSYSGTIFLILGLTPSPMAHILFDMRAANGWLGISAGLCIAPVSGVAGSQSFRT